MQRFELSDGKSNKFWAIALRGASIEIRFGRIGTEGQELERTFPSAEAAKREHDKLIAQKTKKGYIAAASGAPKASKQAVGKPRAGASRPPKRRIGRVINGYSNYLAVLVADAPVAASYSGPVNEPVEEDARKKKGKRPPPDDFERACAAINRGKFSLGSGSGVVVEIGGCGAAEVHRLGDALVIPEIYTDEDDSDTEAELDRVIATYPTTKPKLIGTVDVKSGVLVMMGIFEKGPKVVDAQVKQRGVVETKNGIAVAVPAGRYEVWREAFEKEPEGDWGEMPSRVRVVPAGTKVLAGAPLLDAAPTGPRHHATAGGDRRFVDPKDRWEAIASMVVAGDGRLFAGEHGRHGVAAWGPDGTLLWQRAVRPAPKKASYRVALALAGGELIVACSAIGELLVLDAKTGKEKRKTKIEDPRSVAVAGDRLIVRTGITTTVLAYPSLKKLAELESYVNGSGIALSPDGKYFAVHGHEWHTFELATLKHVRSTDAEACDLSFTADGTLVTVDDASRVVLWDPKSGERLARIDGAKDRSRKPQASAVDTSRRHVAIARDDGAVVVIDPKSKKTVHLFEKHHVSVPGTGATELSALRFTPDGKQLWVSAGPKGAPIGLTAYSIP